MEATQKEFGPIRKVLFPIYSHELRKVLPLFVMFTFIACCYYVLRSMKDMFLLSYTGQAETLYFLKVYGVTPYMIILTIIYSKLSNLHRDTRFFIVIGFFLAVISVCYYIFIPNLHSVTLDAFADRLNGTLPGMKPLWESIRYWPCSLVYLSAEAWGSLALGVLFWTFCNEVISFAQSKRVYAYLAMGAAFGTIAGGWLILNFIGEDLNKGLGISLICILSILVVYAYIANDAKRNPNLYASEGTPAPKKKKVKMSLGESFKFLTKSKHLALIAVIVLCYGAFISLFEAVAKAQVAKLTAVVGKGAMSTVYGYQGMLNGILSIFFVFASSWAAKKGWKFTASITPLIAILCTGLFFFFLFGGEMFSKLLGDSEGVVDVTKVLWLGVIVGMLNQVSIKAAKYVMFDSTCNQAYIPLEDDLKVKGKAAVDGVGSRLGKSFGSFLISAPGVGIVGLFGSIDNGKIFIAALIGIILFAWITSVGKLGSLLKKYEEKDS